MSKVAVVTDSNSGITQEEARTLGVRVVPMPFYINESLYFEDINLTQEEFYRFLADEAEVSTSQPSPGDLMNLWEDVLKDYDELVYVPMSSGLSSSCETAIMLAQDFDGRVFVVDNQRISVTQLQSVKDALHLINEGKSGAEIKEILEKDKLEASIYIMVDTLKYLKKGGRVTPAGAMIGTVLNLKPVLQIQGEKLDAFAKVRGQKQAKKTMIEALKKDYEERFKDAVSHGEMCLAVAHTNSEKEALKLAEEVKSAFPEVPEFLFAPLSLSVSCHIGPGALGVGWVKKTL